MIPLIILGSIIAIAAICLGLLAASVSHFAKQWDAQNQAPANEDAYQVVVLGDSTAQGVGATSIGKSFVGQVARQVQEKQNKPVQIYNFSKSGATAADVAANQLSSDKLDKADAIIVAVGPNDMTRGVSNDEYLKNYQKILDVLPADKVVIATIPPLVRSSVKDATVREWNTDLARLAQKNKVQTAGVYDAIYPRRYDPRIYSADLFHPSNTGYGLWAGAFHKPLTDVLTRK